MDNSAHGKEPYRYKRLDFQCAALWMLCQIETSLVNFSNSTKVPKIFIGHPFPARGPPIYISLFNNTFSQFLQDLQNEDLDVNSPPHISDVANMYAWTQELVELAVNEYRGKGDYIQIVIGADRTISVIIAGAFAWSALFEGKNETGSTTTKAGPVLQVAVYYLKYWSQLQNSKTAVAVLHTSPPLLPLCVYDNQSRAAIWKAETDNKTIVVKFVQQYYTYLGQSRT
ncbi:9047_t:CDS:2 [Paraglomus brasilianum]|uniref:9047_t:CDS:1 n=1 Tax=Paraglomus brasilianum TaxID=144538 RepID=A0A9N9F9H5_9GLOM|nr:9047_t:CDS:2 [Paraglomus brasilianum]